MTKNLPLQIGDIVTPISAMEAKNSSGFIVTIHTGCRYEIVKIEDGFAYLCRCDSDHADWTVSAPVCDLERW